MSEQTKPNSTPAISTLTAFLKHSGARFRVFDLGRRVVKITATQFEQFENCRDPYPYPIQKTAYLGIVFWDPNTKQEPFVWFLALPLDERGLLVQAARDTFLMTLLERVGESILAFKEGEKIEGALKDCPYSFTPREDKMAIFNAKVTHTLKLAPSRHYQHAFHYFTGQAGAPDWQMLAIQGVADVAQRLKESEASPIIAEKLLALPSHPFTVFCQCLEHCEIDHPLLSVFEHFIENALKSEDMPSVALGLRAISYASAETKVDATVVQVLSHPKIGKEIEILATVSGRIWRVLTKPEITTLFLERLAENTAGYEGFSHILAEALYMPGLRSSIMTSLRSPTRSALLSQRVGEMFGQATV